MADDRFQKVENEYFALRGKLETGRITRAEFEAALRTLVFQDAQGRYWTLGPNDGKWLTYDGKQWVAGQPTASAAPPLPAPVVATPVQARPIAPAPQPSSGGGCGRACLVGCVVFVLLCIVAGGAGFWAYQTKAITLNTALNLVGLGPAKIEVVNFRDDKIDVSIRQTNVATNSVSIQGDLRLNAFDIKSFRADTAGTYRVSFVVSGKGTPLGTCTLNARSGDEFQFVALPERIVVNRVNNPPKSGNDFVIETSALCR